MRKFLLAATALMASTIAAPSALSQLPGAIGAKEIEDVLNEHEAVLEAAVVGVPHDVLGEAPVAFVSLRNRGTLPAEELQAFCRERLAPYKMPQRVLFRAELPKSGVGKVDSRIVWKKLETLAAGARLASRKLF